IKGIYILLFLLMTLIVVFSFTWFALYLARGITGPIEQLAEGTREIAAGNLAYKVEARGDDEIGVPVSSFNRMTDDLGKSKRQPNATSSELAVQLRRGGATLSLVASATALRGPDGEYAGTVVVLDDLTELLKAQRVAAWREVAQRIAHEIKNPLTPIQLSAQR